VGAVGVHGDRRRQGVRLSASICWSARASGSIILQLFPQFIVLQSLLQG
jgi:hypothetical protein